MDFRFFSTPLSPKKKGRQASLQQVIKLEQYEKLEEELASLNTVSDLVRENNLAQKAWQYEHVPKKYLKKIIARWLLLISRKEGFQVIATKGASELTDDEIQEVSFAISQDKIHSIETYNAFLKWQYSHVTYLDILNKVNFHLDVFGLLLVALDKEFGCVSSSALDLSSGLGLLMTFLMMGSDFLTLYRVYYRNRQLEPKHLIEMGFLSMSIILNGCSIIAGSQLLMIVAGSLSITQSLVELVSEVYKYQLAPEETDRKMAHLQQCFALTVKMAHSITTLCLVGTMLSSTASMVPAIIVLAVLTTGLLGWHCMPADWRAYIKTTCGLPKKAYFDDESVSEIDLEEPDSPSLSSI